MSKTLYLECYSGISGDMTVGALLDLGADANALHAALKSLQVSGFTIKISRVKKAGLDVCDFEVCLECDPGHGHRGLPEIMKIIGRGAMSERAKETARRIFGVIADAEAKAHGVSRDEVHFHEVGAVDSIVDIVAAAVCLDNLEITDVIVPELCEGRGTVRCQHGILPVPVPAVLNIVQAYGLKLRFTDMEGEFVTPTGAAIAAAIRTSDRLPGSFVIEKTGLGAGKRNSEAPGFLRAYLIGDAERKTDRICKLECNMDDCSGEALGLTMELLLAAGARDVHYTPVFMKKNRPAYQMNVICSPKDAGRMEQIIFENTTTIGIRRAEMERTVLNREFQTVSTVLGKIRCKVCDLGGRKRACPEYESLAQICREHHISFQEAWQLAMEAAAAVTPNRY